MALTPDQQRRLRVRRMNMMMAYAAAFAAGRASEWTPEELFAAGEQGVWYDPSDLSTLFQDSAGTTPVTGLEQPVGLVLDKSKGLVLGSELITNGDFSNGTTGWTGVNSATLSVVEGKLRVTGTGVANPVGSQAVTTVAGRWYKVTADFTSIGGVTANMWVGTVAGGSSLLNSTMSASGSYQFVFLATGTTSHIGLNLNTSAAVSSDFDNISVKELPGNHASQSTSASRPVLSARYNLLRYTEDFSNAAWTKSNSATVTANAVTAPDGTTTADTLNANSTAGPNINQLLSAAAAQHTFTVCLKRNNCDAVTVEMIRAGVGYFKVLVNLTNGATSLQDNSTGVTAAHSATDLGDGWYRVTMSLTYTDARNLTVAVWPTNSASQNAADKVYAWGADLRVTNDGVGLPSYQRVGATTAGSSTAAGTADYDSTGFPYYLRFDGTDDSLATASIDFSGTDKMSVVTGVRKLSDLGMILVETSASISANNGAISAYIDDPTYMYSFSSRGTTQRDAVTTTAGLAFPHTAVLAGLSDISGDRVALRVNGTQVAETLTDQGTGNYLAHSLYIGSRDGSGSRFNGRLMSLIVLGRTATASEIASAEAWVNSKTKAF